MPAPALGLVKLQVINLKFICKTKTERRYICTKQTHSSCFPFCFVLFFFFGIIFFISFYNKNLVLSFSWVNLQNIIWNVSFAMKKIISLEEKWLLNVNSWWGKMSVNIKISSQPVLAQLDVIISLRGYRMKHRDV